MNIGMTSLTLRNENIENVAKYAFQAGLSGIEWGVSELHMPLQNKEHAKRIKEVSNKYILEIFSLGSYCRMLDREECDKTLETAIMLSAPVIRLWAGMSSWEKTDNDTIGMIVENTLYMSNNAKKEGIRLGFEYHTNTLTEGADNAVKLMRMVNDKNVGLYWQPSGNISPKENIRSFEKVKPYLIGNLHVHNHNSVDGYQPLSEIADNIRLYYEDLITSDYNLMIEFVKEGSRENLMSDANTLISLLKNVEK